MNNEESNSELLGRETNALNWHQEDFEQRLGFDGGRFTDTNRKFTLLLALAGTVLLYILAYFAHGYDETLSAVLEKFTHRGFTPYLIAFLSLWGFGILFIKQKKICYQLKSLDLAVVPQDPGLYITPATARAVTERTEQLADDYRQFILLNRIHIALSNLKNIGQVSDVASILSNQGNADEDQIAGSYTLVGGFIWAIPVLGFIGTVLGLSMAMSGFGQVLSQGADIAEIRSALETVTGGLSTAFDTTLLGLIGALILQMWTTMLRRDEARLLDACSDYCQTFVLAKLRIMEGAADGENK